LSNRETAREVTSTVKGITEVTSSIDTQVVTANLQSPEELSHHHLFNSNATSGEGTVETIIKGTVDMTDIEADEEDEVRLQSNGES